MHRKDGRTETITVQMITPLLLALVDFCFTMLPTSVSVQNYETCVDESVCMSFLQFVDIVHKKNQDELEGTGKTALPVQYWCKIY